MRRKGDAPILRVKKLFKLSQQGLYAFHCCATLFFEIVAPRFDAYVAGIVHVLKQVYVFGVVFPIAAAREYALAHIGQCVAYVDVRQLFARLCKAFQRLMAAQHVESVAQYGYVRVIHYAT